jgi:hypothetical protein
MTTQTVTTVTTVTSGIGSHGHKRGRPLVFKRDVVRGLLREAREKNVSLRQLCADKGLAYISFNVAKARYGLQKVRTVNV